jgi:hypothetical protein
MGEFDSEDETLHNFVFGDIVTCENCGQVTIAVMFPVLDLPEPVYLDWELFEQTGDDVPGEEEAASVPSFGIPAKDS